MKIWVIKAIVQKLISFLPGSRYINLFFQMITGRLKLNREIFFDKLDHLKQHLNNYSNLSGTQIPENIIELGTGWFPVIPVGFYLSGSNKIITTDIHFHVRKKFILETLKSFLDLYEEGVLSNYLETIIPSRIEKIRKLLLSEEVMDSATIFNEMNIHPFTGSFVEMDLSDLTINLIVSNNTLEHVNPPEIRKIFQKMILLSSPGTILSHFIDMSDHFSHIDSSISVYNFLKFSDFAWIIINNSIQPQNRERISFYRRLFTEFDIPLSSEIDRKGNSNEIRKIKLAKRFRSLSEEELAITHAYLASKIGSI